MCFGLPVAFSPNETQASLCRIALDFVTNIHKVRMKYGPNMCHRVPNVSAVNT